MNMLDIFNNDAFGVVSLTTGINLLPYEPKFLGQLLSWEADPINTTTAALEYEHGHIQVLATAARGSHQNTEHSNKRTLKAVQVPHVPQHSDLNADDILGVRAFGSSDQLETMAGKVSARLKQHQRNHDVTLEMHRAGAICGKIREPNGDVILNLFSHFGITETTLEFDWSASGGAIQAKCRDLTNLMEDNLQGTVHSGIVALCDDTWFRAMLTNTEIRDSYDRWQNGQFLRDGLPGRNELFSWGGISWYNYRGKVGNTSFLNADGETGGFCRFIPMGVDGLFRETMAPADYMETVNTLGKRFYAKQERMPFDKGIRFESQTNVLYVCTRPSALIKGTSAAS